MDGGTAVIKNNSDEAVILTKTKFNSDNWYLVLNGVLGSQFQRRNSLYTLHTLYTLEIGKK